MEIVIRNATPDDALCLSALAMQVFLDTYATDGISPALAREVIENCSADIFAARLMSAGHTILLAEHSGNLVAFAECDASSIPPHPDLGNGIELVRLYVQHRAQKKGIGKRLLDRTEHDVACAGHRVLWLTAWSGNTNARTFYAANGYQDIGTTDYRIEGIAYENRIFRKLTAVNR